MSLQSGPKSDFSHPRQDIASFQVMFLHIYLDFYPAGEHQGLSG